MKNIVTLLRAYGRQIVLAVALSALGLGLAAVVLAEVLRLSACHLCIFQRLVHFAIGLVLLLAFGLWRRKVVTLLFLAGAAALSIWGMVASAQQSWLQWFPDSGLGCALVEPGLTERLIDWLGQLYPLFFMATGSCESKDLVIFGLSLANWSFLAFAAFLAACVLLLINRSKEGR